ncbi:helical backbone metal receptor [Ichthyenterobacterium sp. W332]|uniref:Helical backbone metal receptor n=1 Tax=Microcosmobacter mediterraneus TaxID=3075607 RepID=A0ABU2YN88_9FLAO|nr:helical backbone metal receptor [Ichthyenterobacterium sp. W332]MDT0559260.1 helical backbone metal receptor [Ichthyenterobacterium sp. W332]
MAISSIIYKDQLNRSLQLNHVPQRIVSLVPSLTELLVDLGLEDKIVGITKFCIHPNQIRKEKIIVGGTKQVNIEKIKTLLPDIILCNKEENTKSIIEDLTSVAPIHISDIYNLKDCLELITMYGKLFNAEDKALEICSKIKIERNQFLFTITNPIKPKAAYFIWKEPWMVAASNTFIDFMLKEAGFDNIFNNLKRYPEIELNNEYLVNADVILLSSEPYPFKEKHVKELQDKFPNKKICIVDGEMFSWYGSRVLKAYTYFKTLKHN